MAALEGFPMTREESDFLDKESPAGVTLFKRNIPPAFPQLKDALVSMQSLGDSSLPKIIAIDQEGGRVSRIQAPFPNLGPAMELAGGGVQDSDLAFLENYGFIVGASLQGLGINCNFAPVADVLTNAENHAIGDRTFAKEAQPAADRAGAFLKGMSQTGVLGCLKHFPGQGDAGVDTHKAGASINASLELLNKRELLPFRQLLEQTPMVMISHAVFESLDTVQASLSKKIIEGLLRQEMGFKGVVVSDDFNMHAVPQDEGGWQAALIEAILAGTDLLLVCKGLDRCKMALEAMRREAAKSKAFEKRLEEAAGRVTLLRKSITPHFAPAS